MIFLLNVVKNEFTRQKEKAIRSDKLKSAFLANMSHEIRTPMNAIVGFSQLLSMENSNDENQKFTNIIQNNSDNLLRLINDIIDLSKIEAGDMEMKYSDFSITEVFKELKELFAIEFTKREKTGIKLDYTLAEGDVIINSDALRIEQVLMNLLDNAMKFTEQGEIIYGLEKKDDKLQFYVSDTGTGIKEEDKENVFNQFVKYNYQD